MSESRRPDTWTFVSTPVPKEGSTVGKDRTMVLGESNVSLSLPTRIKCLLV